MQLAKERIGRSDAAFCQVPEDLLVTVVSGDVDFKHLVPNGMTRARFDSSRNHRN